MTDQVVLKHLREALDAGRSKIPLHQLEVELRMNGVLDHATFSNLEKALSRCTKWESVVDSHTCDHCFDGIRVTQPTMSALRKTTVARTDLDQFRVCTSHECPVPTQQVPDNAFKRQKSRRERSFEGWKLALTVIKTQDEKVSHEVEVELDTLWLVRRPLEILAATGTGLMEDMVRLSASCGTSTTGVNC